MFIYEDDGNQKEYGKWLAVQTPILCNINTVRKASCDCYHELAFVCKNKTKENDLLCYGKSVISIQLNE